MAKKNNSLTKYWMHADMVGVINILFAGAVLVMNMMNGSLALNWKTAKCSISGWPLRMDLLDFK